MLKLSAAISIAIFSSFPIRELKSMMAPIFVTSLVALTASSPWESERRKCWEFNQNPNLWETKQIDKTHAKEKQSHAQDNIYVVWQFIYVYGVAGILLLSGNNTKCGYNIFTHTKNGNYTHHKTLIAKVGSTMG